MTAEIRILSRSNAETVVPPGWAVKRLGQLTDPDRPITYGVVKPGDEAVDGVLFIRGGDIHNGEIADDLRTISREVSKQYKRTLLRGGELVVALVGFPGQSAIVPQSLSGANIARQVGLIAVSDADFAAYVHQFIRSDLGQNILLHPLAGSAQQVINLADLRKMPVLIPPQCEREQITRIAETFDIALRRSWELADAKRRRLRGLMQQLLTGRRRLPAFVDQPWDEVRFRDITQESRTRNTVGIKADRVMAVDKRHGLIPMRQRTMAMDLSRYKVVRSGAFAYNPMRLNIGSLARSSFGHDVVVSPDYVVFEAKGCDPRYLDVLRRSTLWDRYMFIVGNGSVRVRIYYSDLAPLKFKIPRPAEQRAIADVLDTAQKEIDLLVALREQIQTQKRGLMQKLLTGQVRVPIPTLSEETPT